ncbi:helix-turn-helix transcriptional regulator [Catellatospora aurea]|uniref:Helix-turn-helix transcriptional regulator n=1 Tax=Catellatospora aurea TaxID=1337874 RepID=A0ABW2GYW4_9ACTN
MNGFGSFHRTAEVIVKRVGLSQRRKAVGLSQEKLAENLGVDRSTVVRWEAGDTTPQPWHRPQLARALKITVEHLDVLLVGHAEAAPPHDERLKYALAHPSAVDTVIAAGLRHQTQKLDRQYDELPSSALLAPAGQLHGQAVYLRSRASSAAARDDLWAAEAESALLMGQLTWDASYRRDHPGADTYFDQAIAAAGHAGIVVVAAHAELRKSYVALSGRKDPRGGLALAQRAADSAKGHSTVLAGMATLHVGEAHAMLGDARGCEVALHRAERLLDEVRPEEPAAALFCRSTHGRIAGSSYLRLGLLSRAEPTLRSSHTLMNHQRKSTAIVLGNLSLACIRQRKLDEAVSHLHQAIAVLERTRGGGGLNVAFTAAREMLPWRDNVGVSEVSDRLLALMSAA